MMLSTSAYGEYAFSEDYYSPVDTSAWEAFLAEATSKRCFLLELDALPLTPSDSVGAGFGEVAFSELGFCDAGSGDNAGVVTLRFATHGYTSHADDSPANTFYDPRLTGQLVIDRQIAGRDGIGGVTQLFAEAVLVNRDGALDALRDDYAIDGRPARIKLGRIADALSDFGTVFTGVLKDSVTDFESMRISLSDGISKLDRLVNENTYAGTGALEGGDDLVGKFKPRAYGVVRNVSPPLVDSTKLIYQVNDGAINDVPNVYDRGVVLTQGSDYSSESDLNTTAPSAGQYRVYKAGGYFRLGSTPAGTVTADVQGDATGSYVTTTADIVQRILSDTPALNSSEIDPTSFAQLNIDSPADVGYWVGVDDRVTCAQAVDALLAGIGAYGGFARTGAFTVSVLAAPSGTEVATFDSKQIMSIQKLPLPAQVAPIAWRASVTWQRAHTVQNDLASSVTAARRSFVSTARRIAVDEDATIQSRNLLAREFGPVDAYYDVEADAVTEAARLFDLWGVPRGVYSVRLPIIALNRDLGQVIGIDHTRFGFSGGRNVRIIGYRFDGAACELKLLA